MRSIAAGILVGIVALGASLRAPTTLSLADVADVPVDVNDAQPEASSQCVAVAIGACAGCSVTCPDGQTASCWQGAQACTGNRCTCSQAASCSCH